MRPPLQDWSSLVGHVLCDPCFQHYSARGTFDGLVTAPVRAARRRDSGGGERRTQRKHERKATDKSKNIGREREEEGSDEGDGGDEEGGEERSEGKGNEGIKGRERRCSYSGCVAPTRSRSFFLIAAHFQSAGRDWAPLAGQV